MRRLLICLAVVLLPGLMPAPIGAWGFEVHRFITERAIELLPAEMRPFYQKFRIVVVEHSIDPDLWRSAGFLEEPPRHFLDMDAYGLYPFPDLPRDYDAAVQKFGKEKILQNGLLPWRAAEMYGRLENALKQVKEGNSPFALDDVKFFSAVMSHYVGDAHQPFHAVSNYDGQLTNQHGIHARFETELYARYRDKVTVKPLPLPPMTNMRDFIFERLIESFQLAEPVLAADRRAIAGRDEYGDAYFDRLFADTRALLEKRLSEAAAAIATVWVTAWEKAGKPALPLEVRPVNRKVRRPAA